ncbi:hypothetical protein GC330_15495, partial [Yersinia pestis]
SRKCFKFLFVHNLPVSVVGVKISKTGNYTILFTVSGWAVGFLIPFHHPGFSQLTVHPVTSFPLLMSFNLGLKAAT